MPKQAKAPKTQKSSAKATKAIQKKASSKESKKSSTQSGPKPITKQISTFNEQGDYFSKNESYAKL